MGLETNDGRALQRLLDELGRLPGIGPKSAQRIAYHLLEADPEEARQHYGIELVAEPDAGAYDGIVLAVAHQQFKAAAASRVRSLGRVGGHVVYDLKYALAPAAVDLRL